MILLQDIGIQFGGETIFSGVSLTIGARDRIGLVGSNGAGKTTLLRIINGEIAPDTGRIEKSKAASVGFLPQEVVRMKGKTLFDEVATAFSDILETREKLEEIRQEISRSDMPEGERAELIEQMGALQHHLEISDAFRMQSTIEKVLVGLGFREEQFTWMTEQFSGGWQMRIELAKLLLQQPSLLLLDEPTNHLDLHSLRWLEEYLTSYKGSLIIVSHDRAFLDSMCRHIWELSLGKLTVYTGNFSRYVEEKEARKERREAAYKNQQRQVKQTERFIERFRYKATKARQVQSRIKQLEKIERIELEDGEAEISFHFPPPPRSGSVVMELKDIHKKYDAVNVFRGVNLTIERGDRIAFVGVNGAGKSTLAKIIAGVEPLTCGSRVVGQKVSISYFAQNQAEELDLESTPFDIMDGVADGESRKYVRTMLGSFLFQGDDVFKPVRVLSGGEKSRLALAKMLLTPANLLVMDEPTNHLDIRSKEILRKALREFDGTYVIVSHDRSFLEGIINKVIEFRHGGYIREYPGSLEEYLLTTDGQAEISLPQRRGDREAKRRVEKERKRREAEIRQQRYAETRSISEQVDTTEREIHEIERRVNELQERLMDEDLYNNPAELRQVHEKYRSSQERLQELYHTWERLVEALDRVNKKFDELLRSEE